MSELEDSGDDDYEPEIINRVGDNEEEEGEENEEEQEEWPENDNEQKIEEEPGEEEREMENGSQKALKAKIANIRHTYWCWKREPVVYDTQF